MSNPATQFYGDRNGCVTDSKGNKWWIATRVEDVSAEDMAWRAEDHSEETGCPRPEVSFRRRERRRLY
ncbi:MAG TPA: hypothetical protein VGG15_09755 [Terriglobales bacterium]|jgi:hypothetical protein